MKTFYFKLSSFPVFFIAFLGMLIPGIFVFASMLPIETSVLGFFIYMAFCFSIYFLARRISTTMTCWTISQTELRIHWQSGLFFQKRPNIFINWDDIEACKYRIARGFELFKIKLKNGRSINFWYYGGFAKDDFYRCIDCFEEKLKLQNPKQIKNGIS